MAESPRAPTPPESGPDAGPAPSAVPSEVASTVAMLLDAKPQAVTTLFQAFVNVVSPTGGRRLFSEETVKTVIAFDTRRADQSHVRQLAVIVAAVVALITVASTLLILVYLLRDRTDLVRVILAGVGLLVSHGAAFGAGGFVASRRRDRP